MVTRNALYKRKERDKKVAAGLMVRSMWVRKEHKKYLRRIELTLRQEDVSLRQNDDGSIWVLIKKEDEERKL